MKISLIHQGRRVFLLALSFIFLLHALGVVRFIRLDVVASLAGFRAESASAMVESLGFPVFLPVAAVVLLLLIGFATALRRQFNAATLHHAGDFFERQFAWVMIIFINLSVTIYLLALIFALMLLFPAGREVVKEISILNLLGFSFLAIFCFERAFQFVSFRRRHSENSS